MTENRLRADRGLPEPPAHLSELAARRWREIVEVWEIRPDDVDALLLLESAFVAYDRMTEARELLDREGLVVDGGQMVHTHPAVRIERDAAKEMRLSLKQLGLDPGVLGAKRR